MRLNGRTDDLQGDDSSAVPLPQSLEDHDDPNRHRLTRKDEADQASTWVFTINHGPEEDQQRRKQSIGRVIAGETCGKRCRGPPAMRGQEMLGSVLYNLGEQRVGLAEQVERRETKADQTGDGQARDVKE